MKNKTIEKLLKNKKIIASLLMSIFVIPIIIFTEKNNFSANVIELWTNTKTEQWNEINVINDSLNELQNWNKTFFDAFNLTFYKFWEIVEENIQNIWNNKYKLRFSANTTWDSLHEYIYIFEFNNGKLIKISENE